MEIDFAIRVINLADRIHLALKEKKDKTKTCLLYLLWLLILLENLVYSFIIFGKFWSSLLCRAFHCTSLLHGHCCWRVTGTCWHWRVQVDIHRWWLWNCVLNFDLVTQRVTKSNTSISFFAGGGVHFLSVTSHNICLLKLRLLFKNVSCYM